MAKSLKNDAKSVNNAEPSAFKNVANDGATNGGQEPAKPGITRPVVKIRSIGVTLVSQSQRMTRFAAART